MESTPVTLDSVEVAFARNNRENERLLLIMRGTIEEQGKKIAELSEPKASDKTVAGPEASE